MRHSGIRVLSFTALAAMMSLGIAAAGNAVADTGIGAGIGAGVASGAADKKFVANYAGRRIDNLHAIHPERAVPASETRVAQRPSVYAGRRSDQVRPGQAEERAEFAAFDQAETADVTRRSFTHVGRRIDNPLPTRQ